jgi:hypothetical protein
MKRRRRSARRRNRQRLGQSYPTAQAVDDIHSDRAVLLIARAAHFF